MNTADTETPLDIERLVGDVTMLELQAFMDGNPPTAFSGSPGLASHPAGLPVQASYGHRTSGIETRSGITRWLLRVIAAISKTGPRNGIA